MSAGSGPVMSSMTSVTSWSHNYDASPPRSCDGAHEGSWLCDVMGSGDGSHDEKSGGSKLDHNSKGCQCCIMGSQLSSCEIFKHISHPSLNDLCVPTISYTECVKRLTCHRPQSCPVTEAASTGA